MPIDSEHSAIFQCLAGEFQNTIEKIYLTASGGPFKGIPSDQLTKVSPEEAKNHPNWKMGAKISVDSATLINKGFEMIEAQWLFGLKPDQIDIVLHPESIIHSLVEFQDGSLKAQLGTPDMQVPIQYALTYPDRKPSQAEKLDLFKLGQLNFEKIDHALYPNLGLAIHVMQIGGTAPCILNASNEIAVEAFLNGKIGFNEIYDINHQTLDSFEKGKITDLQSLIEVDKRARKVARTFIGA